MLLSFGAYLYWLNTLTFRYRTKLDEDQEFTSSRPYSLLAISDAYLSRRIF